MTELLKKFLPSGHMQFRPALAFDVGGGDAPNPTATANAQGKANVEAARVTTALNRANQVTPWGSLTWTQTPGTDKWTSNVTLDPRLQSLLNTQLETSAALGGATQSALNNVQNTFGAPPPTPDEAYRKQVEDALYGRMTSRLDPQYQQFESDLGSRLAAQGITQGSEAYNREMANLGRAKTDAYQTALDQAIAGGESAISGQFSRDTTARNQVLNELNALRSGQQVSQPQFGATASGATVAPADVSGAVWNAYNAQQAQSAQNMQGLLGLGKLGVGLFTGGLF